MGIGHYLQVIDSDWEKDTTIFDVKSDVNGSKTMCFTKDSDGFKTGQDVSNSIENGLDSSVLAIIAEELLKKKASRQGLEP